MKSLILAEKPSVGKEIGRVLNCTKKQKSFWEGADYVVTWAMGHLVELAEPSSYDERYAKWSLDYLPMLPKHMKHQVIRKTQHQFRAIRGLFNRKDIGSVVIATDAGREGELVARWIMRLGGWKGPFNRLWISSQTDKAIKDGFRSLKSGKGYDNLFHAAECRAEADWIVGLNISRALSCKHDARLSAGRVQTPTLALMAERERAIEGFTPEPYWTVRADFGSFTGTWQNPKGNTRVKDEAFAQGIVAKIEGKSGTVFSADTKKKLEQPPLAFDLTALQRDANVQLGYSAKKTLQVLQTLYERHKYVSYPRTDSRHITPDIVPTLPARYQALVNSPFGELAKRCLKQPPNPGKRFVDPSRVSDHHALIPTEERVDVNRLGSDERALWMMIIRRFFAVLAKPYEYESTRLVINVEGESFSARGTKVLDLGWRKIDGQFADGDSDADPPQNLSAVGKGDRLSVDKATLKKDFTKPPARYTEATLLGVMENPKKFVSGAELKKSISRGGLGTPATRAEIIEKLISSYYIERRGKELHPTSRGLELLELVPKLLQTPELTARWEQRLLKIEKGDERASDFSRDIRQNAVALVNEVRNSALEYKPRSAEGSPCPMCGKLMLAVRDKKGRKKRICQSLSCGYEDEEERGDPLNRRPSRRETATARRFIGKYRPSGNETASFADLIRASQERKKQED